MSRSLFAVASLALAVAAVPVFAQETPADLHKEIDALQSRLNRIEQQRGEQATIDRTQADVLRDAERRSQMLQSGAVTAGYDKGFFIRSADGNFVLKPGVQFQFRNITNYAEDAGGDGDDEIENGFEVRRIRPRLDGSVFSKNLTYSFVFDTSRSTGSVSLLDAVVQYQFTEDWAFKIGQFKESWTHEKDVSGFRQLAVDRTIVDTVIGGNQTDRVQGVAVVYGGGKENPIRVEGSFHDGANSKNTNYQDSDIGNFGLGGRVEYKAFGAWGDYRDFTAKGAKEDLLVLGAGVSFTQAGDEDVTRGTIDVQYENVAGWNAYGAVVAANAEGEDSETDYGFVVQGGYLLRPQLELFGRYALLLLDDADNDRVNEITVGANYYLGTDGSWGHNAKLTLDVVYIPDGLDAAQTGLGYVESEGDQFVLRGQFTLSL